jgi:hypothetical protein
MCVCVYIYIYIYICICIYIHTYVTRTDTCIPRHKHFHTYVHRNIYIRTYYMYHAVDKRHTCNTTHRMHTYMRKGTSCWLLHSNNVIVIWKVAIWPDTQTQSTIAIRWCMDAWPENGQLWKQCSQSMSITLFAIHRHVSYLYACMCDTYTYKQDTSADVTVSFESFSKMKLFIVLHRNILLVSNCLFHFKVSSVLH